MFWTVFLAVVAALFFFATIEIWAAIAAVVFVFIVEFFVAIFAGFVFIVTYPWRKK